MNSPREEPPPLDRLRLEFRLKGNGGSWLFHLKPRAISLTIDTFEVITFDREGRPYGAYLDGRNYRRGLDGRVLEKYSEREEGTPLRQRRFLEKEEQRSLLDRIHGRVRQMREGEPIFEEEPSAEDLSAFNAWTEKMLRWDADALDEHGRGFHQIYRTVSILPPDQYMALVVQSSEGCPWNQCTFCELYRDRPYRVKSRRELQEHLEAIRNFLGEGIRLRRSFFLGDANMLTLSCSRLLEIFEQIRNTLSAQPGPADAFYGFTDLFGIRRHSQEELKQLRQSGLKRLYIGLETGSDDLLRLLRKPGDAEEAVEAVRKIHAAGIQVGIIVLLGLGGWKKAQEHEEETVRALNRMALGEGDVVYFSPLVVHGRYARQAEDQGFGQMDRVSMREQRKRMEQRLRFGKGKPLTSIYDIRDFVY